MRHFLMAGALAAVCVLLGAEGVRAAPIFAVYKGSGCDGLGRLPRYQALFGKLGGVDDFFPSDNWTNIQHDAQWVMSCWKGQPYRLALGIPLLVDGASFSGVSSGAYDSQFRQLATTIIANGHSDALLRIGWEFNGNWYHWNANANPAGFKAAFRRVVTVMRSVPGAHFGIVWNPSIGSGTATPDSLWPGDDVVDLIGLDLYNQSWRPQDVDPVVRWQGHLTDTYGLNWLATFSSAHKKRIAFPEWATGTRSDGHGWGDDPYFIHQMAAWIRGHNVFYQAYWDFTAADFDGTMSAGKFPKTLSAYSQEFKH